MNQNDKSSKIQEIKEGLELLNDIEFKKVSDKMIIILKKSNLKKSEVPLFRKMTDTYNSFCEKQIGVPGKFGAKECKALKSIIKYLESIEKIRKGGDDAVVEAWQFVLANVDKWDRFHQTQLTINQIDSNLINILNTIRNGSKKQPIGINNKSTNERINDTLEVLRRSRHTTANNES